MTEEYIRALVFQWVESGELDRETAEKLLAKILTILFEENGGGGQRQQRIDWNKTIVFDREE